MDSYESALEGDKRVTWFGFAGILVVALGLAVFILSLLPTKQEQCSEKAESLNLPYDYSEDRDWDLECLVRFEGDWVAPNTLTRVNGEVVRISYLRGEE